VFIPRRLNRRGQSYAFVRFCDVRNPRRLEKELDAIIIGNVKIYFNLPRYKKETNITWEDI